MSGQEELVVTKDEKAPVIYDAQEAKPGKAGDYLEYLKKEKPDYLKVLEIISEINDVLDGKRFLIGSPAYQVSSGSRINTPTDCDFCFINTGNNKEKLLQKLDELVKSKKIEEFSTKYLESTKTTLYHFKVNSIPVDLFGQPEGPSEKVFIDLGNQGRDYVALDFKTDKGKNIPIADKKTLVELYLKNFFKEIESLSMNGHSVYDGFKFSDRILKLIRLLPEELVQNFFSKDFKKIDFISSLASYVGGKNIFDVSSKELVIFANKIDGIRREFINQIGEKGGIKPENIFDKLNDSEKMVSELRLEISSFKKEIREPYQEIKLMSKDESSIFNKLKEAFPSFGDDDFADLIVRISQKMHDKLGSCFIPSGEDNVSYRIIEDNCISEVGNFFVSKNYGEEIKPLDSADILSIKEKLASFQKILQEKTGFMNEKKESLGPADFAPFALIKEFKDLYLNKIQKNISMMWLLVGYLEKVNKDKETSELTKKIKESFSA